MEDYSKQILKNLDRFQYSRGRREVFLDAVEYNALNIATKFDTTRQEERIARMKDILSGYKDGDAEEFHGLTMNMTFLLKDMLDNFGDHLGKIYMEIEAGNKQAGQYFTPYDVSRFMAKITVGQIEDNGKIFTINDPCCGSGGMIVAAADVLAEQNFNYTDKMLAVVNDIDRNCVNMAYLQLSFAAVPAVVKWQDTFTQETHDTFITPAFALQFPKFKRVYEKMNSQM